MNKKSQILTIIISKSLKFKSNILKQISFSGRTEFQNTVHSSRARRTVQFERRPSQRYARRQSHVLREKRKKENSSSSKTETEVSNSQEQQQQAEKKTELLIDDPEISAPPVEISKDSEAKSTGMEICWKWNMWIIFSTGIRAIFLSNTGIRTLGAYLILKYFLGKINTVSTVKYLF